MVFPAWLPPLIVVNPWTASTFAELSAIYWEHIQTATLSLDGQRVWYYRDVDESGEEVMFWHLTHREDEFTKVRMPDLPRCAKLGWVAAILANANQPEVTRWDYLESRGVINTYLWLKEHDCLVVLRKYPDGAHRLVTAHHVDVGTRRTLSKKSEKRCK